MLCYKELWTVEETFRTVKHLLSTRPIFHKLDESIRARALFGSDVEENPGRLPYKAGACGLMAREHRWSRFLTEIEVE
jgi:hypothetical protein